MEHRICYVSDQIDWLEQRKQWRNLKTVIMVESHVSVGKHTTIEQRYFISSLSACAKQIAEAIRSHWAIKNRISSVY